MNKRKKIILMITALSLVALTAGIAVYRKAGNRAAEGKETGGGGGPAVYTVETALSSLGSITDYIRLNGDVEAARSIDIYPDAAGKIRNLYVSVGDFVKNSQIVADIDPSRPGLSYALSPVRSTISGTVTSLPYEAGSTVSQATPVARIGDLSLLQVRTEIAEPYIGRIKMGARAELSFVAWPGKKYTARIVEINPVVNSTTRTMEVKLEFEGSYAEVKAGMFASIKMITETVNNAVVVRSEAVVLRDGGHYVFTVEEGRAVKNRVVTGLTVDGNTQIITGLDAGREIVVRGQNLLDEGSQVKILSRS